MEFSFQSCSKWFQRMSPLLRSRKFWPNCSNLESPKPVRTKSISWSQGWWFTIRTTQNWSNFLDRWPFELTQRSRSNRSKNGSKNCRKFCRPKTAVWNTGKLSSTCSSRGMGPSSKFCRKILTIFSWWKKLKINQLFS